MFGLLITGVFWPKSLVTYCFWCKHSPMLPYNGKKIFLSVNNLALGYTGCMIFSVGILNTILDLNKLWIKTIYSYYKITQVSYWNVLLWKFIELKSSLEIVFFPCKFEQNYEKLDLVLCTGVSELWKNQI